MTPVPQPYRRKPVIRAFPAWRVYPDVRQAARDNGLPWKLLQMNLATGHVVVKGRHYHYASDGEIVELQFRQLEGEDFGFSLIADEVE